MGQFTWEPTTLSDERGGTHQALIGETDQGVIALVGQGYGPGMAGQVIDPAGHDEQIAGLPNIEAAMEWAEAHAAGSSL